MHPIDRIFLGHYRKPRRPAKDVSWAWLLASLVVLGVAWWASR